MVLILKFICKLLGSIDCRLQFSGKKVERNYDLFTEPAFLFCIGVISLIIVSWVRLWTVFSGSRCGWLLILMKRRTIFPLFTFVY